MNEVRVHIFSTVIRPQNTGFGLELGTDHIIKINKNSKHLRFMFKEVNPTHLSTIINKNNII